MSNDTKWLGLEIAEDAKDNDALIWFKYWRPPIETLMNGSTDNCLVTLQLMYPCMERVYQLKEGKAGKRGLTKEVLKHFFPREEELNEENYNRIISKVAQEMRNGLAHDAFVREGVEIRDGLVRFFNSGLIKGTSSEDAVLFAGFRKPIGMLTDGVVIVDVRCFWRVVRSKIDGYYTSSEYLINHYMNDDLVVVINAILKHERGRMAEDILNKLRELGGITEDNQ